MKRTTPYKAAAEFEDDLQKFANKFHVTLAEHAYKLMSTSRFPVIT